MTSGPDAVEPTRRTLCRRPSHACQSPSPLTPRRREVLAERRELGELAPGGVDIGALALEIVGDRAAQRRIGDVSAPNRSWWDA